MSKSSSTAFSIQHLTAWLDCYQQPSRLDNNLSMSLTPSIWDISYISEQYSYGLPLGLLYLLHVTLYLSANADQADIETARIAVIKSALVWHKRYWLQDKSNKNNAYYVLALDIQLTVNEIDNVDGNLSKSNRADDAVDDNMNKAKTAQHVTHSFGARYFVEELIVDNNKINQRLQIFSGQDWQSILATLQTPCELVQFLRYHAEHLQVSVISGIPNFDSEQALLTQFMNSEQLFTQAIAIDNALINYKIQDEPNPALVAMSIAQRHQNATAQMYQQHMQQAAILWAQLSLQMLEACTEDFKKEGSNIDKANDSVTVNTQYLQWQQQLLDESLFSRHELVRMLYQYPKQTLAMQESGYVIHQHSYASLGRHYVLIFYGTAPDSSKGKAAIQPNLQQIAQDVSTRLPLAELHHVVVLGIEFVQEGVDTYIDIDTWIQPVAAMTQKERQLSKQLQRLSQQSKKQVLKKQTVSADKLPRMQLNLTIPARNSKL